MAKRSDLAHTTSFRLLGPLEVMAAGHVLDLGGVRQHKALALLLLNNTHVVAVQQIVHSLWDEPPNSVRQQVHNTIASLRRLLAPLGNDVELHTAKAGYRISVPDEILDLAQFRARLQAARQAEAEGDVGRAVDVYESALELWRGPALPGVGGRHISGLVASLNEQRLDTVESLLRLRLHLTDGRDLISELVALLALHPGRESLRAKLMLALYRSGRQADALSVYEEGRRYLADELGVDPSQELRDTYLQLLRGEVPTDEVAAAKPSAPKLDRLCYIPHDVTEFMGRQGEISQVLAAMSGLASQAVVISAIDGMGGIGKTALAIHLAHAIADRFPDGIFFVDLHGFTVGVGPVSSDQALDHLLRQAGVPIELVPKDSEIRSGHWRSHIASKRALIVLDNARNETQVRPLLPGTGGTSVIVTSRRRLGALEGAHPITLDVLTMEDSLRLFSKIVDDGRPSLEPDATAKVINLCGRLPLAIRIAAARFRERKSWTVGHLIRQLDDQQRRSRFLTIGDRSVVAVIAVSYRYLSDAQRRLFRLLALHPGVDFDIYAAAALAGLPVPEAEEILEALFDDSLLTQHSPGRYEFHDLVRDCAQDLVRREEEADDQKQATRRLLDHYLYLANTWCNPIAVPAFKFDPEIEYVPKEVQLPISEPERMMVLRSEYQNFVAVVRLCAEAGWHRHAWQLVYALLPLFTAQNYSHPALELFQIALRAARQAGDRNGEIGALTGLALVYRDRGNNSEAQEIFEQAIAISASTNQVTAEIYLLGAVGGVQALNGQLELAHTSFSLVLAKAIGLGDRKACASAANNIGVICKEFGRFDEALEYFDRASSYAQGNSSASRVASARFNRGCVYHIQRRNAEAKQILGEALALAKESAAQRTEACVLSALSAVHRCLGDLDLALQFGRDSLALAREMELHEVECEATNALGEAHTSMNDLDIAEQVFQRAEEISRGYRMDRFVGRALEGRAHVWYSRGDLAKAREYWRVALQTYPVGYAEADNARQHLVTPPAVCLRCLVA